MSKKKHGSTKSEWNLSQLYKTPDDPQINIDISKAEKAYAFFAKKYKNKNSYLNQENALHEALLDYKKLSDIPVYKSLFYLSLLQDLDSKNQEVRAKINLLSQRLQKMDNLTTFFSLNISKIPKKNQKKFLSSKKLSEYRYMLEKMFESGRFTLTEKEENILSLKSITSSHMWVDALTKVLNKQTVLYKGKNLNLAKADSLIQEISSQKERIELHNKIMDRCITLGDLAESELNAIVTNKKINDELRGFKEPYDSTILSYENDKETILNLVKVVTENFHISKRFYKTKAKMLGVKKLYYADRAVSVGKTKKIITFEESYKTLLNLFDSIDSDFAKILNSFVENGQIDAYPKEGKTSGAYCSHQHGLPSFVLLNHADNVDSMMTFAHEMGHAIHSEFSKTQSVFYEHYSMSTAEVASTLFEQFLFYSQFENLSKEEQIITLHDKIQDDVATIFRQIACFNFEFEMHNTIREKGSMTKEELSTLMNKHMKNYLGEFHLTEKDGYIFVKWPHLRNFFYVYSYAFGQLASKALYQNYKKDKSYIVQIKKFLSLGGSMSPEDIFKSIGVDVKKPEFWMEGLRNIEQDIVTLEKLVKKR